MAIVRLLLSYYVRPLRAPSETLDHGRFWMAVLAAVAVAVLLMAPDRAGVHRRAPSEEAVEEGVARDLVGLAPGRALTEVLFLGCVFTPLAIAGLARWGSLGPTRFVLERDYSGAVTCLMLAWSAAHLPFAAARWAMSSAGGAWHALAPVPKGAGFVYFLILAACVLRTVPGGAFSSAMIAAAGGAAACAGAGMVAGMVGFGMFGFATPCVAYWLYLRFGSSVAGLGSGLSHQQNFRRHLEATTLNPRDADAHYQLGLIYLQRRNAAEAEARFRRAVEIDPEDADYLLALGRLFRESGRAEEAAPLVEHAVRLNRKAGNGEVLREMGAVKLALGDAGEALRHLEPYVAQREYDAEGLVYYGQALARAGRSAEARTAFERAIEAAHTAPSYRRGQVRPWRDRAREELRRL
jgi:Flp pilus assembly protein TadD